MGTLDGKVAFISGAARGQGRSHAVRLAGAGADIIAIDICHDIDTMDYPNATPEDLRETVKLVENLGRRILARPVDVRDADGVQAAVDEGFAQFGRIDIVLPQAGIIRLTQDEIGNSVEAWNDILGTNLTGVVHVLRATIPRLIEGGRGGVIVMTGSTAGVRPIGGARLAGLAYTASKFAIGGIGKQLANALAEHSIRVNVVHPTGVASGMTMNAAMEAAAAAAAEAAGDGGQANVIAAMRNALPVEILQPGDISDAVAFLVSDQAKWITGASLPVDAGFSVL